jgi:hypothetical protein
MDERRYLRVHKHLLRERSNPLRVDVDNSNGGYLNWGQTGLDLEAASRYVNFLYGQPMWTYTSRDDIYNDWHALNELYQFSTGKEDFDAADACVDGMRDILQECAKAWMMILSIRIFLQILISKLPTDA